MIDPDRAKNWRSEKPTALAIVAIVDLDESEAEVKHRPARCENDAGRICGDVKEAAFERSTHGRPCPQAMA